MEPCPISELMYTKKLTKERTDTMIGNIPNGFLSKAELELMLHIIFKNEDAFMFTDEERGSFSTEYYPYYVMRTVPHEPWCIPPIQLPRTKEAIIMQMLEEQRLGGKYELLSSSYRSAYLTVEKKNGKLHIIHDLQPLNRVTIRDASLPPCIDDMIEDFNRHAVYFIADLKAGYNAVPLTKESRDLTTFHAYDHRLIVTSGMRPWGVDKGQVRKGDGIGWGSISESINTLGDLEGLPSLTYIQEQGS